MRCVEIRENMVPASHQFTIAVGFWTFPNPSSALRNMGVVMILVNHRYEAGNIYHRDP